MTNNKLTDERIAALATGKGPVSELWEEKAMAAKLQEYRKERDELQVKLSAMEGAALAMRDDMRKARQELEAAAHANGMMQLSNELAETRAALKCLIGVVNTVNHASQHEIKMADDDEPCYWQRKEWIEYLLNTSKAAEEALRSPR